MDDVEEARGERDAHVDDAESVEDEVILVSAREATPLPEDEPHDAPATTASQIAGPLWSATALGSIPRPGQLFCGRSFGFGEATVAADDASATHEDTVD